MLPLILIQLSAFAIRVSAFGFTPARGASFLYIFFSVTMISLTFVKKGRFCKYSIMLLSLLFLLGSVSPLNICKLAGKSQLARMIRVLEKYEIFDKEKGSLADYDHEDFSGRISDSDRKMLLDSYEYLDESGFLPKWADFSLNFSLKYEERKYKSGCFFLTPEKLRNSEGGLNFKMKTYHSHACKLDSEIIAEMEAQGFPKIDYSYNKDLGFFKNYEVSGYVFCKYNGNADK